jgi:hypothetical protein
MRCILSSSYAVKLADAAAAALPLHGSTTLPLARACAAGRGMAVEALARLDKSWIIVHESSFASADEENYRDTPSSDRYQVRRSNEGAKHYGSVQNTRLIEHLAVDVPSGTPVCSCWALSAPGCWCIQAAHTLAHWRESMCGLQPLAANTALLFCMIDSPSRSGDPRYESWWKGCGQGYPTRLPHTYHFTPVRR